MTTLRPLALAVLLAGFVSASSAAIESWTNLDGQKMQAEFLGRKGDYVSFKKEDGTRYLYPYAKLDAGDRARIDALAASGVSLPPEELAAEATPPPAKMGAVPSSLAGKLVEAKGDRLSPLPRNQLAGTRYVAFYYSAKWCPPCRAFTPELVSTYKEIKAKHPEFELVFVSSDRDEKSMQDYMTSYNMAWPALRFGEKGGLRAVKRPSHENGIPNLVFMDADGKELSLSFTPDGDYRGPQNVLRDIKKHFKM